MFQAPKLTDAGKNLYYRNMAGEGIKFTTIQLGNGTISGPISAMTALFPLWVCRMYEKRCKEWRISKKPWNGCGNFTGKRMSI